MSATWTEAPGEEEILARRAATLRRIQSIERWRRRRNAQRLADTLGILVVLVCLLLAGAAEQIWETIDSAGCRASLAWNQAQTDGCKTKRTCATIPTNRVNMRMPNSTPNTEAAR